MFQSFIQLVSNANLYLAWLNIICFNDFCKQNSWIVNIAGWECLMHSKSSFNTHILSCKLHKNMKITSTFGIKHKLLIYSRSNLRKYFSEIFYKKNQEFFLIFTKKNFQIFIFVNIYHKKLSPNLYNCFFSSIVLKLNKGTQNMAQKVALGGVIPENKAP